MGWYDEERVREVFDGFRAAGLHVELKISCRGIHETNRSGNYKREHYHLDVNLWNISGESEDWKRFIEVCDILNITWKMETKGIRIEPFMSEWGPLHEAHKRESKQDKGFCAECEEHIHKPISSALCDSCAENKEYSEWKQERAALAAQS